MNPDLSIGCLVHLMKSGDLVRDGEGHPYIYQIIAIHKRRKEVSLINSFGDYVGRYYYEQVIYFNSDTLFDSEDYEIGQKVIWIENDSVYEGRISKIMHKTVDVSDVKMLMPVDYVKRLPYYRIYGDPNK